MRASNKTNFSHTLAGRLSMLTLFTILAALVVSWFTVSRDMRLELDGLAVENIGVRTAAFMKDLEEYVRQNPGEAVSEEFLESRAGILGVRITVIGPDGSVLGDSEVASDKTDALDNHRNRPEVRGALASGSGTDRRRSETTGELYIYYAIASDNGFVVRSSYPLSRHYALLSKVRKNIFGSLMLSGFLALAAGIIGSRRITSPIRKLIAATHSVDSGCHAVYPTEGTSEILELSRVLSKSAQTQAEMMDELRNERNQLDTIVQSAPCGLMLLDSGGTVVCANRFFAPLMRSAPDDAAGMLADGELRSPELIEIISEARRGGVSSNSFAYRQNGAETSYTARAVPTATGEMLVVLNDETERKKMETARKTFVADAGHEFQTPLTAISAAAELLDGMDGSTARERAPYIKEIMRQRERMTVLVDDLLLLSRLESGTPCSSPERFDLSEMCGAILRDAMKNPLASNISWSESFPADDVYFEGRPEEIKRAVSNLLDNSVKYVRKRYRDRVGGHVAFSLEVSGADLLLRVEDNGVGIPVTKLGRIFGRFERVEDDRARDGEKTGGYGLGLAIAKHAVESHGGHVEANSSEDATVFTVRLPSSGPEAR